MLNKCRFDPPARSQAPPAKHIEHIDQRAGYRRANSAASASCTGPDTPDCLQSLYGIPSAPANASGNSLYVSGLGGAEANPNDLEVGFLEIESRLSG